MIDLWFSPILPVALYLGGAVALMLLPAKRLFPRKPQLGLALTLLVLFVLISRAGIGQFESIQQWASWRSTTALSVRLDSYSLAFALIPTLFLVGMFWSGREYQTVGLLVLAGAATAVFITADPISLSYALFGFDLLGALYWFFVGRRKFVTIHLLLTVATVVGIGLTQFGPTSVFFGQLLQGLLWLRVSVWPLLALSGLDKRFAPSRVQLTWVAVSTVVGVYSAAVLTAGFWSTTIMGLIAGWMLLIGWLAWLENQVLLKYLYLTLVQANLAFLIAPLQAESAIALSLLYTLSLGALWLTPQLGKPNVMERHWLWIYAAPIFVSLSLLGVPYTFGWFSIQAIYNDLLLIMPMGLVAIIIIAHGLALSVIQAYWQWLLQYKEPGSSPLRAALILVVPFLVPWLGGLTFATITGLGSWANQTSGLTVNPVWAVFAVLWLIAFGAGFGRRAIVRSLQMVPQTISPMLTFGWVERYAIDSVGTMGQGLLRFRAVLEGRAYLSWGILLGLLGLLLVIFR